MVEKEEKLIYLNNAATTFPKPEKVKTAISQSLNTIPGLDRGTATNNENVLARARNVISKFFNLKNPDKVIFTSNCTEALNFSIKGTLEAGDHVILDNTAHNSLVRPLITLEKKGLITLTRLNPKSDYYFDIDEIKSNINNKTKLVAISHASNVTGVIQDVERIGNIIKDTNAFFLVDGAQSAGQTLIDIEKSNIDFFATAGHKSLFGPTGTGLLCISEKVKNLNTIIEGGTGSESEVLTQPTTFPHILESGTHNFHGISGLLAGIEFIISEGLDKIHNHEKALVERFTAGFNEISGVKIFRNSGESCSVVSFVVDGFSVGDIGAILADSFNIVTRTGLHCSPLCHTFLGTIKSGGTIRISPGYFNTNEEIDFTIKALKEITQ